jgi:hypothetical protein
MKRITCPVALSLGRIGTVAAYLAAPGLAVHRGNTGSGTWVVRHILTGRLAMPKHLMFHTRKIAARYARCIAEVIDFEEEDPRLQKNGGLPLYREHVVPALERFKAGHDPEVKNT